MTDRTGLILDPDPTPGWAQKLTRALTVNECCRYLLQRAERMEASVTLGGDEYRHGAVALREAAADLPAHAKVDQLLKLLDRRQAEQADLCDTDDDHLAALAFGGFVFRGTDPAKPGAVDRSVEFVKHAESRDGLANPPCGCTVSELRVGVRMTADQLGAEAYCMVCGTTLTGVDVVAVQR